MPIDIETLNGPQREAVVTIDGPLLVLAGAGSGKTRVLTYRIANLIENHGVAPWEILAITFTNKAAAEMRERLAGLVGPRCRGMWVSTFHSMCVRILRADAERLGFTRNFTIYDVDDQKRLYKEIMAELDIDPKRFPANALMNRISTAKNELVVPGDFENQASDPVGKVAARVYARLQERLKAANAFDFDDLLLYAYLLLKNHEDVRAAYQQRFRYLMVDEYQDTNHAQYAITQLLAEGHKNIMVVGDDDQSIYSWRGADLRNILEFEQDYPNAHVVKLEQNYRSVGNVLAAANAVIANNQHRKQKKLFTASEDGEKINVYLASDERDEGRWIAGEIEKQRAAGLTYNQVAVFYRTNAQSRMLEDMLLRAGVPYRIVGGTRFFDRAEIRDVMAYLTLIVNPADDIAAKRVVNVPRRGIGKTTIERIEQFGREMDMPFIEAAELAIVDPELRASTRQSVASFVGLINEARTYGGDLRKVIEAVIDKSGLIGALQAENTDEARGRIENIQEFLGVVDEFVSTHDDEDADYAAPTTGGDDGAAADAAPTRVLRGDSLADFIEWVRLRTDLDTVAEDGNAVTLMTVHSSKGLEFDCVFVAGMRGDAVPAHELGGRCGEHRGGAPPGLRGHHARPQAPVPHLRLAAPDLRAGVGEPDVALHPGDPLRAAPVLRRGVGGLQRHGLGEARQPSRHRGLRRRGGGGPRVRPLKRLGFRRPLRPSPLRPIRGVRAPRGGQEGRGEDGVRHRRLRGPQDVRPRQGDEGGRRHALREIRQIGPDEEAAEGLRAHREDRRVGSRARRCGAARFFRSGLACCGLILHDGIERGCAIPRGAVRTLTTTRRKQARHEDRGRLIRDVLRGGGGEARHDRASADRVHRRQPPGSSTRISRRRSSWPSCAPEPFPRAPPRRLRSRWRPTTRTRKWCTWPWPTACPAPTRWPAACAPRRGTPSACTC